jgi:hypothetical protein
MSNTPSILWRRTYLGFYDIERTQVFMMSNTPMLLFRVSGLFEFSLVSYSSTAGRMFSWSLIFVFNSAIGITRMVCRSYIREYLRNLDMKDIILNLSKKQSLLKTNQYITYSLVKIFVTLALKVALVQTNVIFIFWAFLFSTFTKVLI